MSAAGVRAHLACVQRMMLSNAAKRRLLTKLWRMACDEAARLARNGDDEARAMHEASVAVGDALGSLGAVYGEEAAA